MNNIYDYDDLNGIDVFLSEIGFIIEILRILIRKRGLKSNEIA